jgi:hypothetical protein
MGVLSDHVHWEFAADASGRASATLMIPGMPKLVLGGDEAHVYRYKAFIQFPRPHGMEIHALSGFIGTDRGDIVEADIEADGSAWSSPPGIKARGIRLPPLCSLHKEIMGNYPAYHHVQVTPPIIEPNGLHITLICRVNGEQANPEHLRFGSLTAMVHFGLIIHGVITNAGT